MVEGKYDIIRLKSVVDTVIVETNGFGVFQNKEQLALLRLLAAERGLIILTDSDSAGFVIRNYLIGTIPSEQVKHAYIPELLGKERRKDAPSKEGLLGVEGVACSILLDALRRAGATFGEESAQPIQNAISKGDLFEDGLTGGIDSSGRRSKLLSVLGLPQKLSTNRLLEVMNATMTKEEYRNRVQALDKNEDNSSK